MKRISVLAIIAMAILATTVAVVSCKKEKQEQTTNKELSTSQLSEMDKEMLAFGERLKSSQRNDDTMPVEEAVSTMSNYQNFLLCDASYRAPEMICDTFEVELPVSNGMVRLSDLNQLLDANRAKIRVIFNALNGVEKKIFFITSKVKENGNSEHTVQVQTVVWMYDGKGRWDPNYTVLFDSTDHWKDFNHAGKCGGYEGQNVGMDALSKLQSKLREYLPLPAGPGSVYFSDEIEIVDMAINYPYLLSPNGQYALPYVEDSTNLNCVSPEGMLWYYDKLEELYESYAAYYDKFVIYLSLLQNRVGLTPAKQCVVYLRLATANYTGYEREDP